MTEEELVKKELIVKELIIKAYKAVDELCEYVDNNPEVKSFHSIDYKYPAIWWARNALLSAQYSNKELFDLIMKSRQTALNDSKSKPEKE